MIPRNRLILLPLPTLVAAILLIVILDWHIPTRVRITLTTDKLFLKIGGVDKANILDSVGLKSVVIEKFDNIKLKPETLALPKDSAVSRVASHNLEIEQPVVITPRGGRAQSNVTLSADPTDPRALLLIDAINATPTTEVTMETTEDSGNLILRVDGQRSSGSIAVAVPFRLAVDQSDISGIRGQLDVTRPLTFNGKLLPNSLVQFGGQEASLVLTVTVPPDKATPLLPQGHMLITAIKFEQLDGQSGKIFSSLTKNTTCEISYPDYDDKVGKATITRPDFLWLDDLQSFSVEDLTYNPEQKGISVRLLGVAERISSGSLEYSRDHRLTVYNALWNNHKVIALFAALCWVTGTTLAFYKFFKES
jgi:hypothetical protein